MHFSGEINRPPYETVESGDDVVLKRINKGYTAAQAREQLEKIDAAGLPFIVNFLNGAGGHGYGLTNAQLTAKLYDRLHPTMVNSGDREVTETRCDCLPDPPVLQTPPPQR